MLDLRSPRKMSVYIHRLAHAGYLSRVYEAGVRYVTSFKGFKWLYWYLISRSKHPLDKDELKEQLIQHAQTLAKHARTIKGRVRLLEFANHLRTT